LATVGAFACAKSAFNSFRCDGPATLGLDAGMLATAVQGRDLGSPMRIKWRAGADAVGFHVRGLGCDGTERVGLELAEVGDNYMSIAERQFDVVIRPRVQEVRTICKD